MNQLNTEINASVNVPMTETNTDEIITYDNCFQNITGRSYNYKNDNCKCKGKYGNQNYGFLNPNENREAQRIVDQTPVYLRDSKKNIIETMVPVRSQYGFNRFTKKENFEKYTTPEMEKKIEHKTNIIYTLVIIILIIGIFYLGIKFVKKMFCCQNCCSHEMLMFGGVDNEIEDDDFVEETVIDEDELMGEDELIENIQ